MSKGFNKATVMGNLTRDPEMRTTPGGNNVTSFTLAVNRYNDEVDFIDCVAWGKQAELINTYMEKGQPLLVSGRLQQSTWEKDGIKRSKVEVIVEDFNFLGGNTEQPSLREVANQTREHKANDVAPEDISGEPVDLSQIPF